MVLLVTVREIGRSKNCKQWRSLAGVVWLVGVAVLGSACTSVLRDPGVDATCAPLRYSVTVHEVVLSQGRLDAIDDAVREFGALLGRSVEKISDESGTARANRPGDPIVFELVWPEDEPAGLGFAEPHITGSSYDGGWVMLNPTIRHAPTGLIRRLVLHELGHLVGLDHVDDTGELMDPSLAADGWGPGDLVGLMVTHDGGCAGSSLGVELLSFLP